MFFTSLIFHGFFVSECLAGMTQLLNKYGCCDKDAEIFTNSSFGIRVYRRPPVLAVRSFRTESIVGDQFSANPALCPSYKWRDLKAMQTVRWLRNHGRVTCQKYVINCRKPVDIKSRATP